MPDARLLLRKYRGRAEVTQQFCDNLDLLVQTYHGYVARGEFDGVGAGGRALNSIDL